MGDSRVIGPKAISHVLTFNQSVHPKIVQERLGHASIQITLDTYSHVAPGLQEAAVNRFDDIVIQDKGLSKKKV